MSGAASSVSGTNSNAMSFEEWRRRNDPCSPECDPAVRMNFIVRALLPFLSSDQPTPIMIPGMGWGTARLSQDGTKVIFLLGQESQAPAAGENPEAAPDQPPPSESPDLTLFMSPTPAQPTTTLLPQASTARKTARCCRWPWS
ncbi:MAG TPA: hypothetical protein VLE89_03420 [Chlamydiales bacterium]|nr:hypothetical protein [Chlamydiales bacterium]